MKTANLLFGSCFSVGMQALLIAVAAWKTLYKVFVWYFAYLRANFALDLILFTCTEQSTGIFFFLLVGDAVVVLLILSRLMKFLVRFSNFYGWLVSLISSPVSCVIDSWGHLRACSHSGSMASESLVHFTDLFPRNL